MTDLLCVAAEHGVNSFDATDNAAGDHVAQSENNSTAVG